MPSVRRNKIQAEIDKAREKLAEQQAQVRKLEAKRTEIENTEIVDIVRGFKIPLDELGAILQQLNATSGSLPQSGEPLSPKLETPKEPQKIIKNIIESEENSDEE